MDSKRVETGVDALISLLEDGKKHFIDDLAKNLDVSLDVVQLWIDFLVEEKIISIEYSFTKPFVFLNRKSNKTVSDKEVDLNYFKDLFFDSANEKKIPTDQIETLWKNKLETELNKFEDFFKSESEKRNLKDISTLWKSYKAKVQNSA